jgi:lipopolysaccharide export system permease protein
VIVERYVVREVGASFLGVLGVLLVVWVSHRFVRYLAQAAAGVLANDLILQLLALKLAANLPVLLPPALFLGVLLGLGRLHRDSEAVAMFAAGIRPGRLLGAAVVLSALYGLGAGVVALWLGPAAARVADGVEDRAAETADFASILAGRFKALSGGDRVLYAEGVGDDGRTLERVFVQVRTASRLYTLTSDTAQLRRDEGTGDRFLVLIDGYRYEGEAGSVDFVVTRFREHAVRIEEGRGGADGRRLDHRNTLDLIESGGREAWSELHWRLAVPLSVVVLGALAVPLARTSPRQGRYGSFFHAVLIYFVYSNLLGAGRELVEQGRLSPTLGLWPVHAVFALTALGLVRLQSAPPGYVRVLLGRLTGGRR